MFADGAEEALGGAEHVGGPAHGVGGVVVVVETAVGVVCCHRTSLSNALEGSGCHTGTRTPKELLTPSAGPHTAPALCFRTAGLNAAGDAGIADA
ncbi:hypothetical protein GCM10010347_61790 [Streptomyces cirratus]|uniref:Uncharacterized protein n=1 Tax=Streptomyces cirratus TaxID=68187 RepID=A0ABQ3F3L9_9ACTN|nr:hypothetical protein GCM10010347_61790 [Streptomyces cirratus]